MEEEVGVDVGRWEERRAAMILDEVGDASVCGGGGSRELESAEAMDVE